jgi:3-oxoacyl-[acyl-carrier protein] reductase
VVAALAPPLAGRVALVTGVSRRQGIGFALVRRLLADGASVFASGWRPHDAEMPWGADPGGEAALLAELGGAGARLHYAAADLERPEAAAALVDAAHERFGALDIAVANHGRSSLQSFEDVTVEELDRCWAANARSCILLLRRLAERRAPGPGGRLLTFTSGQHIGPMPREVAYAVSKGAVHQMTATLADAVADRGITVNCINPGPIDTGYATGRAHERIAKMFPAGRWGTPDDVARLVAFLVSDEAAWITGQVIDHEGGFRRWARGRGESSAD